MWLSECETGSTRSSHAKTLFSGVTKDTAIVNETIDSVPSNVVSGEKAVAGYGEEEKLISTQSAVDKLHVQEAEYFFGKILRTMSRRNQGSSHVTTSLLFLLFNEALRSPHQ